MRLPAIALSLALSLHAADWDRFRGPNGSGVADSTSVPAEFGPGKNLRWKTVLPPGHSSPILSGSRIFLTAYEGDKLLTFSLDRETGKILWRREAPRTRKERVDPRNSPASPSPVSDGKNIYVFFGDYGLVSYSFDGGERWKLPLGPFDNMYGMGSSPVIAGDKVVLVCDQTHGSFIIAAGKDDGKVRWRHDRPEALSGHSTPIVWEPKPGDVQIIAPSSFRMDTYSASTGEIVWFVRGLASEMKSVPVIGGDTIFINGYNMPENDPGRQVKLPEFAEVLAKFDTNKDGKLSIEESPDDKTKAYFPYIDLNHDGFLDAEDWRMYSLSIGAENGLLALRPADGRGDLTASALKWAYRRAIPQLPSVVLYRDVLYMINDSGILTTLNPANGTVFKQARLRGSVDKYFASPVAADGKVFFVSLNGTVTVLEAGPDHKVIAKNELDDEVYSTPAVADGRIFIRSHGALWCFAADAAKGS